MAATRSVLCYDVIRPKAGIKYLYRNLPIIMLHGLFGQKNNLKGIANSPLISTYRACYLLDLRNHGDSFHSNDMNFESLVDDVIYFQNKMGINRAIWCGHSYGGKIAYLGGLMYPQFVSSIISLDVSPVSYQSRNNLYINLLKTFQKIENINFKNRKDIEQFIINENNAIKPEEATFLISTLQQKYNNNNNKKWIWKMNVDVMLDQIENITKFDVDDILKYNGKTYVIRGGDSKFINDEHIPIIKEKFPNVKFKTIDGGTHYLHLDKTDDVIHYISQVLQEIEPT